MTVSDQAADCRPSISIRFSTAAPDAPSPRLSNLAMSSVAARVAAEHVDLDVVGPAQRRSQAGLPPIESSKAAIRSGCFTSKPVVVGRLCLVS
jgi:hypothetical protein